MQWLLIPFKRLKDLEQRKNSGLRFSEQKWLISKLLNVAQELHTLPPENTGNFSNQVFGADSLCIFRRKCGYTSSVLWFGTIFRSFLLPTCNRYLSITSWYFHGHFFLLLIFLSLTSIKYQMDIAIKFLSQCIKYLKFPLLNSFYSKGFSGHWKIQTKPILCQYGSEKTKFFLPQKSVRQTVAFETTELLF